MKKIATLIIGLFSMAALAQDVTLKATAIPGSSVQSGRFEVTETGATGVVSDESGAEVGYFSLTPLRENGEGLRTVLELAKGDYFSMDVQVGRGDAGVEATQSIIACQGGDCVELERRMFGEELENSVYKVDGKPASGETFEKLAVGMIADFPETGFAVVASAQLSERQAMSWPSFGNSYLSCLKQAVEDCGGSHNNGNCQTFQHWGGSAACGAIHAAACGVLNPISVIGCAAALLF